jgi:cytoskeletal protein CcmA (bactofilin family)
MTTIGASLSITGEVSSSEDVTVHGKVNGKIVMHGGALNVSPTATIQAEAQVGQITIQGTFSGDVAASQRVELASTAQVTGTVIGPAIVMHDGAVFNGVLEVNRGPKLVKAASA